MDFGYDFWTVFGAMGMFLTIGDLALFTLGDNIVSIIYFINKIKTIEKL